MSKDRNRAEFEIWHAQQIAAGKETGIYKFEEFLSQFKETMAVVWQESRNSVVIDLPFLVPHYRKAVVGAIEHAGVKVKS